MPDPKTSSSWDFESAIDLLGKLSFTAPAVDPEFPSHLPSTSETPTVTKTGTGLGDFSSLWDLLGSAAATGSKYDSPSLALLEPLPLDYTSDIATSTVGANGVHQKVNTEPEDGSLAIGWRRRRAMKRAKDDKEAPKLPCHQSSLSNPEYTPRSTDRRAVIDHVLARTRPSTPPTSPSRKAYTSPRKQWPATQPSLWTAPSVPSPSLYVITQRDGLMTHDRIRGLISQLKEDFPEEKKYLKNRGLVEPTFTALNVSDIGIHVFIDISNISIGFHDCLKMSRGIDPKHHVRQVPMNFHLFSLVLERGRPATKRVLVGSDKSAVVDQAKALGFETNILERVHKVKELTPRQKRFNSRAGGDTSGSETNTGSTPPAQRWVEQAVDEILHLKILESLIDYSDKPSTIVLATGDAAEAEYSGGFLRMVERALEKGWVVELVSFKLNTSNLYKRKDFRRKWGAMFKWVQLDDYADVLIASDDSSLV